ncbi:MAG: J domain-containing protein, partial [Crocosphaera sp.]
MNKETQISKILCQAIAFLKPVPKTNGLEKSPTYQVMGEPIYWDELVRNYKQLVIKWHPDNNPSVEAVGRIQLITQIYQELKTHWMTKYSPLISLSRIGEENLQRAMSQKLPWT